MTSIANVFRSLSKSTALFLVGLLVCSGICIGQDGPPNIILIVTDDQGYGDISAHGSPDVLTPNMDKLKAQSISLSDFHVSSTCSPSRSAIMTGKHPFKNGVTHTVYERERMSLKSVTLPQVLKRGGFTSGIFGKWHLGDENIYQPGSRGFDEVFVHGGGGIGQAYPGSLADAPENSYFNPIVKHNGKFVKTSGFCTDIFFKQALSWIRTQASKDQPFFAYIATNAPHFPFLAPDEYKKKFADQNYPKNAQGFYGMIENIDDNLGLLMDKLEEWKLTENTIIIFMSDNGKEIIKGGKNRDSGPSYNAGLRGYKLSPYEGGTRAPFFIRWTNRFQAGKEVKVLQNHYDILPTLADVAEINLSDIKDLDGQSFLPFLIGENSNPSQDRYRFIHTARWPLYPSNVGNQKLHPRAIGTIETSNPNHSKFDNCAVRNERFRWVNNSELYDVLNDPGETTDISEQYPEVVTQMKKAYDKWWNSIQPFLVNEKVVLPDEKPYWAKFYNQQKTIGIPKWDEPNLD